SRFSSMTTSLPSSPPPQNRTRVAVRENGVPIETEELDMNAFSKGRTSVRRLLIRDQPDPVQLGVQSLFEPRRFVGGPKDVLPERSTAARPHRDRLDRLGVALEDPPVLAPGRAGPETFAVAISPRGAQRAPQRFSAGPRGTDGDRRRGVALPEGHDEYVGWFD